MDERERENKNKWLPASSQSVGHKLKMFFFFFWIIHIEDVIFGENVKKGVWERHMGRILNSGDVGPSPPHPNPLSFL